jgi:hypothetical protein
LPSNRRPPASELTTSTLTGTLTLPPATGSFKELGLVPVTATTEMIQDGTATGTVNFTTNAVTTTATDTIKMTSLKVAGLPIPVGSSCETVRTTHDPLPGGSWPSRPFPVSRGTGGWAARSRRAHTRTAPPPIRPPLPRW